MPLHIMSFQICTFCKILDRLSAPGGVLPNKEVGGFVPHVKFGGKIWGKVRPSSPNKRKSLGSSVTIRRKRLEKSQFWGHIVNSDGKIWVFVTYIFGGKIWDSNKNFRGKFWGQVTPRPPYLEVPPGLSACQLSML